MCRVLYLPKGARPPLDILKEWLDKLEKSFGGDGNGIAMWKTGIKKGVKMTTDECADIIHATKGTALFHTRRSSCGGDVDELCHPFDAGDGYLIHNGHWNTGAFFAPMFKGQWSDTKVAALAISHHGFAKFTEKVRQGVWIYLSKSRGLQVAYETGDLWVDLETGALCSEPCIGWGYWIKAMKGYHTRHVPGESLKVQQEASLSKQGSFYDDDHKGGGMVNRLFGKEETFYGGPRSPHNTGPDLRLLAKPMNHPGGVLPPVAPEIVTGDVKRVTHSAYHHTKICVIGGCFYEADKDSLLCSAHRKVHTAKGDGGSFAACQMVPEHYKSK